MEETSLDLQQRFFQPHFMVVPSLFCPASCRYCFGPNTGSSMDIPMADRVIDFIDSVSRETGQRAVRITLHGGEPLAAGYPVIERLITSLHKRFCHTDLKVGIQSNLWLLNEKYCDLFSRYKVEISTSLDGPRELNDRQRGAGSYDKILRGIEMAHSYGIDVGCIATFTSWSMPQWRKIFDFFMERKLHFSVHPAVSSIAGRSGLEMSPEQYWDLFREMFVYYVANRKHIRVSSFDQICQGAAANDGRVCTFRDCFGMFLAVDPDGDIYSCQRFAGKSEFRLGNISERPALADLVGSPAALRHFGREQQVREACGTCNHYYSCRGGCTYNALTREDPSDLRDPLCESYQKMFSYCQQRIYEDMISDDNLKAVAELGPAENGNPLLRSGPVIELTREHSHPFQNARTARRIIAAYEMGKHNDMETICQYLVQAGISQTIESAHSALAKLSENMTPRGQLNKLYIHVTWNCQLRCSHCYAQAGDRAAFEEMNADRVEHIIRDALPCGFKEVVITGGEPLVHKDWLTLLERLAALRHEIKPVKLVLRTNLTRPLSIEQHLLLGQAFDHIVVSVDGDQETHDGRRGVGTYEKVVQNMETYVRCTGGRYSQNTGRMQPAVLSIAASMGAAMVNNQAGLAVKDLAGRLNIRCKFRPLLPLGRARESPDPIIPEPLRSYLRPMELIEEGFTPVATCGIGQNLYVEPSGHSFPCYAYHHPGSFLGNVISEGLAHVIGSESFQALQGHTVDTNHKCKTCAYRYLCGGACRAWGSRSQPVDLDAAPAECAGLRQRAEDLYQAALEYI